MGPGFLFDEASGEAMQDALERCLATYRQGPEAWSALRSGGMDADFGWERPARAYAERYAATA
jgi:starch synthase